MVAQGRHPKLTQAVVPLVWVALVFSPSAAQMLEDHGHVAKDDQRWGQNRPFVESHDKLIPLKLPHLVGYGFYLKECIAEIEMRENQARDATPFSGTRACPPLASHSVPRPPRKDPLT